ncbi:MAG TPA: DUF763 domain-containing protein [Terriglobia bacterium]|nr:DUF763 domain-containing protein [Terriglobia bacterium]
MKRSGVADLPLHGGRVPQWLADRMSKLLSMVAEVVHGTPTRFSDPARFSFALGGKDGHPFPVPLKTYDESISVLQNSLDAAKLGDTDKLQGFERLHRFMCAVEGRCRPAADFDAILRHEHAISPRIGGRTVLDDKMRPPNQLDLFERL